MDHVLARQKAHTLIELMEPGKVAAAVGVLEEMLDPVSRAIANAPFEDEEIGEDERQPVAASREWLKTHESISYGRSTGRIRAHHGGV